MTDKMDIDQPNHDQAVSGSGSALSLSMGRGHGAGRLGGGSVGGTRPQLDNLNSSSRSGSSGGPRTGASAAFGKKGNGKGKGKEKAT